MVNSEKGEQKAKNGELFLIYQNNFKIMIYGRKQQNKLN